MVNKAKLKPTPPKIRIQKVPSLATLPHRDMAVDLSDLPFRKKNTTPKFYSEEEDDALNLKKSYNEPESDDDEKDDDDEDLDEEPSLSLGDLDHGPRPNDYAAKALKNNKDESGYLLKKIYEGSSVSRTISERPKDLSHKIYFKLAITFAVMVLAIIAAVVYFAAGKATVGILLKNEQLNKTQSLKVIDTQVGVAVAGSVNGLVKEVESDQTLAVAVTGTEVVGEQVSGQVTVYNNYNKNQPLVASTRLLSASGKLYRIKNSVVVPSGGQIIAQVYADQPSESAVVGAEKFTIPGLWEGLQDKIYAESKTGDIKYGQQTKNVVSQDMIEQALKSAQQNALDKVKADADNTYSDDDVLMVKMVEGTATTTVDAKAGQERDSFNVVVHAKYDIVAFKDAQAKDALNKQLLAALPANKKLINFNTESVVYDFKTVDAATKSVDLSVAYTAEIAPVSIDSVLDKNKLTDLSDEQLRTYLKSLPEVGSFEINYFPAFIKKTPSLPDRITIQSLK